MEETEVCIRASALSDEIYKSVSRWSALARQTIGIQLINCIDSVGANLIEGDGRGPGLDALRFFRIARASCREARYWVQRSKDRDIADAEVAQGWIDEITRVAKMINSLITFRKSLLPAKVREVPATYDEWQLETTDPLELD